MSSERPARSSPSGAERRRHPRAAAEGRITLDLRGEFVNARLRDISRAGVSFFCEKPLPLMTLLDLRLELAHPPHGRPIQARGAVVRSQRIAASVAHWEIAVFLHDISETDRDAIEAFVAARLPHKITHSASSAGE